MKCKPGVTMIGIQIQMLPVLKAVERIWPIWGGDPEITDVAGVNWNFEKGCLEQYVHSAGSLHPYGYAVDFSIDRMNRVSVEAAVDDLKDELPAGYDVVLHSTHVHVEWDDAKKLLE